MHFSSDFYKYYDIQDQHRINNQGFTKILVNEEGEMQITTED